MHQKSDKSIGRNLIYQSIYQILNVITPLITSPYVSRVLGAEGLGEYSYAWTSALYFTLFAMLGVNNYGCRAIAQVQNNKKERSIIFWNIYALQASMTIFMIVLYALYLFLFDKKNSIPATIQIIIIVNCLFDVNWYFFGVEKFKITVRRNIIVKVLTVLSVLLLVNQRTGVVGYSIVMSMGTLLSNVALIPFLKKEIVFVKPTWNGIKSHMVHNIIFFIPALASSIFHIMDKTMLGAISGLIQLGYYMNADKVINIPIGIINGLGTVYLPRITAMRKESRDKQISEELYKSIELYSFVIFALSFGIASISKEFSPLFFGSGFEPCGILIIAFAPAFIMKSYSSFFRTNILIPYNREAQYTIAVILGAVSNVVTNILLIPYFGAFGAVMGTVVAEIVVFIVQLYNLPIKLKWSRIIKYTIPYMIIGGVMMVGIRIVSYITISVGLLVVFQIVVGIIVYVGGCIIFWKNSNRPNILAQLIKR